MDPNVPYHHHYKFKEELPNATATLALGIITIVMNFFCCISFVGIVTGILAIVFGINGRAEYKRNPDRYTETSYKNLNAGFICGIIGLGIYCLALFVALVMFLLDAKGLK